MFNHAGLPAQMSVQAFGEDEIYYGSVPIWFQHVDGRAVPFMAAEWRVDPDGHTMSNVVERAKLQVSKDTSQYYVHSQGTRAARRSIAVASTFPCDENRDKFRLALRGSQKPPGSDVADIVIPGIPALDIECVSACGPSTDVSEWPAFLRSPVIKTDGPSEGECPKAVASGVRSALVKLDGLWYRLKGCGNGSEGFTVRESRGRDGVWRDIRGAVSVVDGRRRSCAGCPAEGHTRCSTHDDAPCMHRKRVLSHCNSRAVHDVLLGGHQRHVQLQRTRGILRVHGSCTASARPLLLHGLHH
jgi:hypothetical protein